MTDTGNNPDKKTEGGGRKFATFLAFSAAALAVAGAFLLTGAFIAPADRLGLAVPAQAALYIHGDPAVLRSFDVLPQEARAELGRLPEGVRPYDAAVFAVPDDNKLVWGAALGWRIYPGPTADEDRLLRRAGWTPVARGIYAVGAASRIGHPDVEPLVKSAGRSLRAMAGLLPVQGYVAPGRVPDPLLTYQLSFIKDLQTMVFGLDPTASPVFVLAMPETDAAALPPFFGFGMPHRPAGAAGAVRAPGDARVTMSSASAAIDPLNVLFGEVEKARLERQAPPTEGYLAAAEELRLVLSGPVTLSLLANDPDGRVRYVADFSSVSSARVKSAVLAYLSASLPDRKIVSLPDGTRVVELEVDPEKHHFETGEGTGVDGAEIVRDEDIGFRVVVAPDGKGGQFISTETGSIKEVMEKKEGNDLGRCRRPADASVLDLRVPIYGFSKMRVISTGDKLILACGYHF